MIYTINTSLEHLVQTFLNKCRFSIQIIQKLKKIPNSKQSPQRRQRSCTPTGWWPTCPGIPRSREYTRSTTTRTPRGPPWTGRGRGGWCGRSPRTSRTSKTRFGG